MSVARLGAWGWHSWLLSNAPWRAGGVQRVMRTWGCTGTAPEHPSPCKLEPNGFLVWFGLGFFFVFVWVFLPAKEFYCWISQQSDQCFARAPQTPRGFLFWVLIIIRCICLHLVPSSLSSQQASVAKRWRCGYLMLGCYFWFCDPIPSAQVGH